MFISYPAPVQEKVKIIITDLAGREKISEIKAVDPYKNSMLLNISSLENGIYFINLQAGKQSMTKKLLVVE